MDFFSDMIVAMSMTRGVFPIVTTLREADVSHPCGGQAFHSCSIFLSFQAK